MSLIVVGTVAFDSIATPSGKADRVVGGAASYIALAASHFVKEQELISVIGEDFPNSFLSMLESRGVGQTGLKCIQGEKSFFWEGAYHDDLIGRDTLVTELNVLEGWEPEVPIKAREARFVMLGNLDPAVQLSVLNQLDKPPELVVLDTMNFWMEIALESLLKVIARVDVLMINDDEARQLSSESSLLLAAEAIHRMGPRTVVIKKGEHGAMLFEGGKCFYSPAYPLKKVIDPTGAGDTFAGGFIGYLTSVGETSWEAKKKAVVVGSVLASFTCEAFGTERIAGLKKLEWHQRTKDLSELIRVDYVLD
jgi:sugar/nucleoside kinase (ribokinase family)